MNLFFRGAISYQHLGLHALIICQNISKYTQNIQTYTQKYTGGVNIFQGGGNSFFTTFLLVVARPPQGPFLVIFLDIFFFEYSKISFLFNKSRVGLLLVVFCHLYATRFLPGSLRRLFFQFFDFFNSRGVEKSRFLFKKYTFGHVLIIFDHFSINIPPLGPLAFGPSGVA